MAILIVLTALGLARHTVYPLISIVGIVPIIPTGPHGLWFMDGLIHHARQARFASAPAHP